ncbi:hypothetical protein [uncultured Roseovarius sp.]|uniref:hypothetical protein n=1 Tax=uncultured Roseovarius sp. TaxID=293344 RepID=UPI00262C5AF4|nr:hypothetical protein [uncultured Roseovarius sp.]
MSDAALPDLQGRPKGRLLKKLSLFPLATALLGGGGFGAWPYYAGERLSPSQEVLRLIEQESGETGPRRMVKEEPETTVFETQYSKFADALTTNLKGSRRFLQVRVGISTQYDATVITNVETHAMALRSDMLAVISGFATARRAQPTVPLTHIVGLNPARVVQVDLAPRPQLLFEGTALFDGESGAQDGRAALSLTRKLDD